MVLKDFLVRITYPPFHAYLSLLSPSPIIDHFFSIRIELINIINDGWIKESQKECIYGHIDILIADVMAGYGTGKEINFPL